MGSQRVQILASEITQWLSQTPERTSRDREYVVVALPWVVRATFGHSICGVLPGRMHVLMSSPIVEMIAIWTLIVKCTDLPGMMKNGIRVPNNEDGLYGTDGDTSALHFIPSEAKTGGTLHPNLYVVGTS